MTQHEIKIERAGSSVCILSDGEVVLELNDIHSICTYHESVGAVEVFSLTYVQED